MDHNKFLKEVFENYTATSIEMLFQKAHEIIDCCEQKIEIINYETLEPYGTFDYIDSFDNSQQLRESLTRAEVTEFLGSQEAYAIHKPAQHLKPVTYFVVKNRWLNILWTLHSSIVHTNMC